MTKIWNRAGEMERAVKSTDYSSEGPEFTSEQPHGGSQTSVMRSSEVYENSYTVLYTLQFKA